MPGVGHALIAVVDLAVIGLGVGDELREIVRRQILPRDDDQRIGREHADRLERPRIERRLGKHQMRDAVAELRDAQQRVAVGRRTQHLLDADTAAGAARPVLDHHLLAERRARLLAGVAAQQVGGAAGRKRHDQRDRAASGKRPAPARSRRPGRTSARPRTVPAGGRCNMDDLPRETHRVCRQHSASAPLCQRGACDTGLRSCARHFTPNSACAFL